MSLPPVISPSTFHERVLVVLVGIAPQILTETVYALARAPYHFVPTRIVAITSAAGKGAIVNQLLSGPAHFKALCDDSHLGSIAFSESDILTPADDQGVPFEDIHSQTAFERTGDLILNQVRRFAAQKDTVICVSLTGGRKTMSYLAGVALSLVARSQDMLTHVLIADPRLEYSREFFYPNPRQPSVRVRDLDGSVTEIPITEDIVTLECVPYLPLRELLPSAFVEGGEHSPSLTDTMTAAHFAISMPEQLELAFDSAQCNFTLQGQILALPPTESGLLYTLAQKGEAGFSLYRDHDCLSFLANRESFNSEGYDGIERLGKAMDIFGIDNGARDLTAWTGALNTTLIGYEHPDQSSLQRNKLIDARKRYFEPLFSTIRRGFEQCVGPFAAKWNAIEFDRVNKVYRLPNRITVSGVEV